nr:PREDICTED: uncharacterized protein LOC109044661 [Bemisia tabaci]
MGAEIKKVFFATLAVLLIQVVHCAKDADHDEVKQDLDTLLKHQEEIKDNVDSRLGEGRSHIESAREDIKSAISCFAVHESLSKVVSFLRVNEEKCSKEAHEAICKNLCLLLKYTDSLGGECQVRESRIGKDVVKMKQVQLEKVGSVCHWDEEKDRALQKLSRAGNAYESDVVRSGWESRKAINTIYNGIAVLKKVDVELRGGQRCPTSRTQARRIVEAALELRHKFHCFAE